MSSPGKPFEVIQRIARNYERGVICPTETWYSLLNALPEVEITSFLNGLPATTQRLICDLAIGRPAEPPADSSPATYATLRAWCAKAAGERPR